MSIRKKQPNVFKTVNTVNSKRKQRLVKNEIVDVYASFDFVQKHYATEQNKIKSVLKEMSYDTYIDELSRSGVLPVNPKLEGYISSATGCIRKRNRTSGITDDEAKFLDGLNIPYIESIPDLKIVSEKPMFELRSRDEAGEGFVFDEKLKKVIEDKLSEIKDPRVKQAIKENHIFSQVMKDDEVFVSRKSITDDSMFALQDPNIRKDKKLTRQVLDIISNFSISPVDLLDEFKDLKIAFDVLLKHQKNQKK